MDETKDDRKKRLNRERRRRYAATHSHSIKQKRKRVADMSPEAIEKQRARKRVADMSSEAIEIQRKRKRAERGKVVVNKKPKCCETSFVVFDLGDMTEECSYCKALYFKAETVSYKCCRKGQIVFPQPLIEYPQQLKSLLLDDTQFRQNILKCNRALSFATLKANIQRSAWQVLKLQGPIYHYARRRDFSGDHQIPEALENLFSNINPYSAANEPPNNVYHLNAVLQKISEHLDPMTFPLLFPNGELGWSIAAAKISLAQYYRYRLSIRRFDESFNPILYAGKLTQLYLIHAYSLLEDSRLSYLRFHQERFKRPDRIVLPSTFIGSRRHKQQLYRDSLAMFEKFGNPDLFITMTCNPRWNEFQRILETYPKNTMVQDIPIIACRVFNCKLMELIRDIFTGNVLFGDPVTAYEYTVQFQTRSGLPYARILIVLENKLLTPEDVDRCISAELPADPVLYDCVTRFMLKRAKNKNYPREFTDQTTLVKNDYPLYQRRGDDVHNGMVVPYNPYLLKKYQCHLNVECCTFIGEKMKYFLHSGGRRKTETNDEIQDFLQHREIGAIEAAWKIWGLPLHKRSHSVIRLPEMCMLDWFRLNQEDPNAESILYRDIPQFYKWDKSIQKWVKRTRKVKTIGRMLYSTNSEEDTSLKWILSRIPGAKCINDFKRFNGQYYDTFKQTAMAMREIYL